jgi:hypothetical protein
MSSVPPMRYSWDGEALKPFNPKYADKHLIIGCDYIMGEQRDRSDKSHSHYFACINHAWANLPEGGADAFPTADHLRARALIACGYAKTNQIVCKNGLDAMRFAVYLRDDNDYHVVTLEDNVVTVFKAMSQNYKSMPGKMFQKSKEDVLQYCADMIGVTVIDLAGAAAEDSKRNKK